MILVNPSIEIVEGLDNGQAVLEKIERCARVCYKSEGKIDPPKSTESLINKLIKREHWVPFEFHDVIVKFIIDRGISHELVRHRLCSFLQESSRYCNYGDSNNVTFVVPYFARDHVVSNASCEWYKTMKMSENAYLQLLDNGEPPQAARSVLPNSLKTEVIVKANLREWRHIFNLRCSPAAHPDIQYVMKLALKEFNKAIPLVFKDLYDRYIQTQ